MLLDAWTFRARTIWPQTTVDNAKHWAAADKYDADSANSRWVRQTMVKRSRYEAANNGYVDGMQSTPATFVVRKGPRLRILHTANNIGAGVRYRFARTPPSAASVGTPGFARGEHLGELAGDRALGRQKGTFCFSRRPGRPPFAPLSLSFPAEA